MVTYGVRVGSRVILYNENTVLASAAVVLSLGRRGDQVHVGDWDGDGRDTLALVRGSTVLLQVSPTSPETGAGTRADLGRARPQGCGPAPAGWARGSPTTPDGASRGPAPTGWTLTGPQALPGGCLAAPGTHPPPPVICNILKTQLK